MSGGPLYQAISDKISKSLNPLHFEIHDDSSKHAGHAAMKGLAPNETHFRLLIVSNQFDGLSLIKRHRAVNALLKDELLAGLHALQLETRTEREYQEIKNKNDS